MDTAANNTNVQSRDNNARLDLVDLYKQYLQSKEHVWTPATMRSESYRLKPYLPALTACINAGSCPTTDETKTDRLRVERMWAQVKHLAPYTRATTWIRITKFYDWILAEKLVAGLVNPFTKFRLDNPQLFRNIYERKIPDISFKDVSRRIDQIQNESDRARAKDLLRNGLRLSDTRIDNKNVKGKGGKVRRVYHQVAERITNRSDASLRRSLKGIKIKPHDLRKIAACELARQGASAFALTKIFGWSNINTAQSYIAASDSECEDLMQKLR